MTVAAAAVRAERLSAGPWLWGAGTDLALFGGTALVAFAIVVAGHATGLSAGDLPEWGWLAFVLCVDVAHVWSTIFRTYLDGSELRSHPARYVGVPLAAYAAGVALYLAGGSLWFWRVLAYVAVFHFIRQQVGWVAVYRARAGERSRTDKLVDEAAVYMATLYPLVHWHAHLAGTRFAWFVQGDFIDASALAASIEPVARVLWVAALAVFVLRQIAVAARTRVVHTGKIVVVATTVAIWYVGIVVTNSDFDFTVTNVLVHGVPYFALLWAYARERRKDAPRALASRIAAGGVAAFMGVLLVLAFVEEMAWDKLVWHDRGWLFGAALAHPGAFALALIVPLLALPQSTHYVLDGMLWRRGDTRALGAQRRALGFPGAVRE